MLIKEACKHLESRYGGKWVPVFCECLPPVNCVIRLAEDEDGKFAMAMLREEVEAEVSEILGVRVVIND